MIDASMARIMRIYTDGGSRGNPGPAASGAVLKWVEDGREGETVEEVAKYLGHDTNNQAEYTAIIIGLKRAHELGADEAELVMDSELACKQLKGEYRVKNPEIAKRFLEVKNWMTRFSKVSVRHVLRAKNKEADAVVNRVLDEATS